MKHKLLLVFKILCVALILFSAFQLIRIAVSKLHTESSFKELRSQVMTVPTISGATNAEETKAGNVILPQYQKLHKENPQLAGWLTIVGTSIDYPVMHSPDDPEYYLEHAFDGSRDYHGVPFLQAECDILSSDNLTVFGHSMHDGTMFADLLRFGSADFCKSHRKIRFNTLYDEGEWEVVCVFKISEKDTADFPYHSVTAWTEKYGAEDYLSQCRKYAVWSDDEKTDSRARLLTLSTCEYTLENGRLAVVAKRV